jgi:hypothetical protein
VSEDVSAFPWPPYYGHFNFFEARMRGHSRVKSTDSRGGGIYDLMLVNGSSICAFICECYSFGVAEYVETVGKVGGLNAIIINSAWCGYTLDAKRTARADKVGLYKIADFMAALNKANVWEYLSDSETDAFKKKGWI